ncbi:MAG TPA: phospholipase [Solirubrobacteraceae bacterium]|nr:phospholipase [Solirubrobacteraceae bacterium]
MSALVRVERPPAGEAAGLLVLHHGRGTDERDLIGLADVLDPKRRLHVVSPRAPLSLPGSPGYHWYLVPRVGFPDPVTFRAAQEALAALHDELWEQTGIGPERTVLGGFSMGCVMSYATGFDASRPAPAGILGLSGFIPSVEGWDPALAARAGLPVFVAHGSRDAIISVEFARDAVQRMRDAGVAVEYHESESGHHIDPRQLPAAVDWLARTLGDASI